VLESDNFQEFHRGYGYNAGKIFRPGLTPDDIGDEIVTLIKKIFKERRLSLRNQGIRNLA
jgi:hypothetical protein